MLVRELLIGRITNHCRDGRPCVSLEVSELICVMSIANPLWGTPRIHGELLRLGINVGQTTVAKYLARKRRPASPGWKTFLRNHAGGISVRPSCWKCRPHTANPGVNSLTW